MATEAIFRMAAVWEATLTGPRRAVNLFHFRYHSAEFPGHTMSQLVTDWINHAELEYRFSVSSGATLLHYAVRQLTSNPPGPKFFGAETIFPRNLPGLASPPPLCPPQVSVTLGKTSPGHFRTEHTHLPFLSELDQDNGQLTPAHAVRVNTLVSKLNTNPFPPFVLPFDVSWVLAQLAFRTSIFGPQFFFPTTFYRRPSLGTIRKRRRRVFT